MGSSDRLFNRQRTVHEILGAGIVADVMLWRRKDLTLGILLEALAAWVVFEISGYTLLTLVSSVFLLLFTILFLWAKSAAILNRPPPPLPHLHLSEEIAIQAANLVRDHVNTMLSMAEDIARGRDSRMFVKVALSLLVISIVGSLSDFFTLGYICKFKNISTIASLQIVTFAFVAGLVMVLTVPALYERYEDRIDMCALTLYRELQRLCVRLDEGCINKVHRWTLEKKKLS